MKGNKIQYTTILFTILLFAEFLGLYLNYNYILKIVYLFIFVLISKYTVNFKHKIQFVLFTITIISILLNDNYNHYITILGLVILFMINKISEYRILMIEGITYVIIDILYEKSGVLFNVLNMMSYNITSLFNAGTPLGESISAIFEVMIIMICNMVLILTQGIKRDKQKIIKLSIIFLLIYIGYINIISYLLIKYPEIGNNLIFFIGIIMTIYNSKAQLYNTNTIFLMNKKTNKTIKRRKTSFAVTITCLMLTIGLLAIPILLGDRREKITIVNNGTLVDLTDISNHLDENKLGYALRDNIFSTLPTFLEMNEYKIEIVEDIDEIQWKNTDNIIFINYNKIIKEKEEKKLEKFTLSGGNIFVFSDHTNMDGVMEAANSIISFTNLRVKNDISDPFLHIKGGDWTNSLQFLNSYSTYGLNSNNDIQVWGGASIENNICIEPIIMGKYGFSDMRDDFNDGNGGFLGNRSFDRNELGGNTILAAKQKFGKGTVYIFGDTSYIQTPALFLNSKFMSRIFFEATTHQTYNIHIIKWTCIIALIFIFVLAIKFPNIRRGSIIGVYIGIILVSCGNYASCIFNDYQIADIQSQNITAIDYSLMEDFDKEILGEKSIGGSLFNIYKNNNFPIVTDNWDETLKSKNMLLIAPQKKLSAKKIDSLNEYLLKGNNIVIFAGWNHYQNLKAFLNQYDIYLDKTELGPVPYNNESINKIDKENPEFKEAYPIISENNNTIVLHDFKENKLAIETKINGGGKIIYISDSRFLYNNNVEGESDGKMYNINFLKSILEEII